MRTLSNAEWGVVRGNLRRGLERIRHDEETSLAAAIQKEFPEWSRNDCLREACRILEA